MKVDAGGELYSAEGALAFLGCTLSALENLSSRGELAPFRCGLRTYYTRRDLERHKTRKRAKSGLEAEVIRRLHRGENPVDVYLALDADGAAMSLKKVLDLTGAWARGAGVWIVQAPPGSHSRWVERMGRIRITPRDLRRCIEDLLLGRVVPKTLAEPPKAAE